MSIFTTLQHFTPQTQLTHLAGKLAASRHPLVKSVLTRGFAALYDISLDDYARQQLDDYTSFNDFFTRELQDLARPISTDAHTLISPADGQVSQIGTIDTNQLLQAKNHNYTLEALLGSDQDAPAFYDGSFATVYLAPSNYHRVHMPIDGTLVKTRYIPGRLFSVNTQTAANVSGLFARNERMVCLFQTPVGKMAVVLVGAMIVAGIETVATGKITRSDKILENTYDLSLQQGDELGRFYLGSTAIVVMQSKAGVDWLSTYIDADVPTPILMGQPLGRLSMSAA